MKTTEQYEQEIADLQRLLKLTERQLYLALEEVVRLRQGTPAPTPPTGDTVAFSWRCRRCLHVNKWVWGAILHEEHEGEIEMICDQCGHENPMISDGKGGFRHHWGTIDNPAENP